ncbi:MAG: flagellar basal body-associated FliL family protein [Alphaproteobacteria bacterium]
MKKTVLIGVAAVLLLAGGFTASKFLLGNDAPKAEEQPAANDDKPVFITLDPFVMPVIREDRVSRQVSVTVKLEVAGKENAALVKEKLPLLRDAMLTRLHAVISRSRADGQTIDAARVKRVLLAACERVLGKGPVRDVLIEDMAERDVR